MWYSSVTEVSGYGLDGQG